MNYKSVEIAARIGWKTGVPARPASIPEHMLPASV